MDIEDVLRHAKFARRILGEVWQEHPRLNIAYHSVREAELMLEHDIRSKHEFTNTKAS